MKKIIIVGVVVVLVLVAVFSGVFTKGSKGLSGLSGQQVSKLDAPDTVRGFYEQWLKAAQDPTAAPNLATLAKSPILSQKLRDRLAAAPEASSTIPDRVLCQKVVPKEITFRNVFENAVETQILVTSKDKKVTEQALVKVISLNDGWYIGDIECSLGEFAPEKEFSFEMKGNLLKGSVPPPYNSKNWHLVFEENGVLGNVVPIFFDSKSQCTSLDGIKSVCKPAEFKEATKVFVRGQMTERGATVNQLEFVK